jgi:peptide/nickel transport system permease protein
MSRAHRFFAGWQNLLALAIISIYVAVAITAPWLAPQDDPENPVMRRLLPGFRATALRVPRAPQPDAILGTAPGGADIFFVLVWGTRPTLYFGLVTAVSTAFFGVLVGAIGGYVEGPFYRLILRITDAFLTVPAIAGIYLFGLVLAPREVDLPPTLLQNILQTFQLNPVMLALIIFSWMPYARLISAHIITLKGTEYAMAAKTLGVPPLRIIFRHLLPNAIAPAIVLVTRDVGGMVLLEAAFTFIGIGAGLPWGVLLVAAKDWVIGPGGNPLTYWWTFIPATLALVGFSIGWNLLGDGLNNMLNPRQSGGRKRW